MTIRRTLAWTIPGTPEAILRRLADPEVAARRAASDPSLPARVTELAGGDGELVMSLAAELPSSWIPAQIRSRIETAPRIVRREVWDIADDGAAYGDIDVAVESVPATTMTATGRIAPAPQPGADGAPDTSELSYLLSLSVALPLVGGVVERAVMEKICAAYEREAHVIADA